jgi:hypothetical protein
MPLVIPTNPFTCCTSALVNINYSNTIGHEDKWSGVVARSPVGIQLCYTDRSVSSFLLRTTSLVAWLLG